MFWLLCILKLLKVKLAINGIEYEEEEAKSKWAERSRNDKNDEEISTPQSWIFGVHSCDKGSFVQGVWNDDQTPSSLSDGNADNVKWVGTKWKSVSCVQQDSKADHTEVVSRVRHLTSDSHLMFIAMLQMRQQTSLGSLLSNRGLFEWHCSGEANQHMEKSLFFWRYQGSVRNDSTGPMQEIAAKGRGHVDHGEETAGSMLEHMVR